MDSLISAEIGPNFTYRDCRQVLPTPTPLGLEAIFLQNMMLEDEDFWELSFSVIFSPYGGRDSCISRIYQCTYENKTDTIANM